MQSVCLVIGAGAGIGGNVGKRFASEGYHAVLCRRTDEAGLDRLVKEIKDQGWEASGPLINAVEADSIENCVFKVEAEIGPIDVVVYNKFPKDFHNWLGCCYGNKEDGIGIELTRDQEDMYQTLAHEMIHVKQFLSGLISLNLEKKP